MRWLRKGYRCRVDVGNLHLQAIKSRQQLTFGGHFWIIPHFYFVKSFMNVSKICAESLEDMLDRCYRLRLLFGAMQPVSHSMSYSSRRLRVTGK